MSSLKNNYQLTSTSYLSPLVLLKTSTEAISSYFPSSQRQQLERRGREMDCTTAEEPDAVASDTFNSCFDCNICLDIVVEPVVTVCGHLYCWSCIYKWLQQAEDTSSQQCPVCKAALSETTLVPLYGRGCSSKNCHQNLKIPRRPSVHREIVEYHMSEGGNGENTDAHQPIEYASSDSRLMNSMTSGVLEGMAIGVMRWLLGCQDSMDMHYMSPYYVSGDAGSSSIRMQEVEVVKSLHQIWLFLFVFAVLCLLLF